MSMSQAELDALIATLSPGPVHAGAGGACPDYGSTLDPCPPGCASGTCVANYRRCHLCNIARHLCPGCGTDVPHGTIACVDCSKPTPLVCTICMEALDEVHRDLGTHPLCDPTPAPTEVPASTISTLRDILVDFEANSPRSTQVAPGPSELAVGCDRRLAYRVVGTPERPDGRVKWAPMLGTAAHAMLADALLRDNAQLGRERWLVEQRVFPDPAIGGSCDAYDTDIDTVVDWKLVGPTRLDHYRRKGPGPQYEGQIQLYGRGWQRAGRSPRWVRIVFLARGANYDDAYEWTAPYSRVAAEAVMDRFYRVLNLTADLKLAEAPELWAAVPASPGDDCRFCPYLQRGKPAADQHGCPGDVAADVRRQERLTEGLIV